MIIFSRRIIALATHRIKNGIWRPVAKMKMTRSVLSHDAETGCNKLINNNNENENDNDNIISNKCHFAQVLPYYFFFLIPCKIFLLPSQPTFSLCHEFCFLIGLFFFFFLFLFETIRCERAMWIN